VNLLSVGASRERAGRHTGQRQQRAALGVRLRTAALALHAHLRELYPARVTPRVNYYNPHNLQLISSRVVFKFGAKKEVISRKTFFLFFNVIKVLGVLLQ
jgi:hypothetical protein